MWDRAWPSIASFRGRRGCGRQEKSRDQDLGARLALESKINVWTWEHSLQSLRWLLPPSSGLVGLQVTLDL